MSDEDIREAALEYHRAYPPGKISILPTKQLTNQRDLAMAYTPGVAAACDEIVRDPIEARTLTARGNLVGVVTNGTAVLGLGAIGPLASKPVMEGKSVLFKKFAGRHQSRRHQSSRVLLRRTEMSRANENSLLPR